MIEIKRFGSNSIVDTKADTIAQACANNIHDLYGADLSGAYLVGVRLYNAYMSSANLTKANLNLASLYGSTLTGADFTGANIKNTVLERTILTKAIGILRIGPIGSEGRTIYAVNHVDKIMIQAGCFYGDIDEFIEAVIKKHTGTCYRGAYVAAIQFIQSYSEKMGWKEYKYANET